MALFIETKRPATATALVPSQVIEIDRKLITRMLNEYPQIALKMRQTLSDRLTATIFDLTKVRQTLARIDRMAPPPAAVGLGATSTQSPAAISDPRAREAEAEFEFTSP